MHQKLNEPIIINEFEAGTYVGMQANEAEMYTEEFQIKSIKVYLQVAV